VEATQGARCCWFFPFVLASNRTGKRQMFGNAFTAAKSWVQHLWSQRECVPGLSDRAAPLRAACEVDRSAL
jgi:hypothetical protein